MFEIEYAALAVAAVALLGAGLAMFMQWRGGPPLQDFETRLAALERPKAPNPAIAELNRSLSHLDQKISQVNQRVTALTPDRPSMTEPRKPVQTASNKPLDAAAHEDRPSPVGSSPRASEAAEALRSGAPQQADAQWVARLLADYARMAEEGGAAVDAFVAKYEPSGAAADAAGAGFLLGEDAESAMLWAVSADPRLYALLPGLRALNNWSAHFAPSRKSTAQEHLGAAFDLTPDTPAFGVRSAALAVGDEGQRRLVLTRKGRLEGFIG